MADTTTQAPTNTYKLSYSGPEVNERLGRLGDTLVKTGDTAYDLKVEGTMTNDTDAVNVAWVNRLLNQNYLSLKGTSNSAPVLGPISTKGAIYDFPTEHRAVFTHDFLTLGGYRVLTAAGAAEESGAPGEEWKNDKTEFNLVYVDNSQLEQLDGGKLLHSNIFHPKTGEYESDTSRFDSPAKKDESGQTHQEKYILPKIRFSNLAFYPKYLLGTQSQDSFEDFSKEYLESPKYGYGITDVTFSDREGQGDDGEGNPLTVSLAGKEYGLTVRLGTEATTCKPITRQVAYAGNTLTHYNLFGDLVYKNSDDKTTGIPTPTEAVVDIHKPRLQAFLRILLQNQ